MSKQRTSRSRLNVQNRGNFFEGPLIVVSPDDYLALPFRKSGNGLGKSLQDLLQVQTTVPIRAWVPIRSEFTDTRAHVQAYFSAPPPPTLPGIGVNGRSELAN